ncbi:MAG: MFS transporter [Anaerolineae bacterium]|nr:MFS transporter [Anaerolineae bacterium]
MSDVESAATAVKSRVRARYLAFAKSFYACFYAAGAFLAPYLALYYSDLGLSGGQIGVLRGIAPLVSVVAAPAWGAFADLTRRHKLVRSVAILGTWLAVLGLALGRRYAELFIAAFLFAIFGAPITSLVDNAVLAVLGRDRARYGQQRLWGAVGWGIGGWISGFLIERYGLTWSFAGYLVLMAFTGLLALGIPSAAGETEHPKGVGEGRASAPTPKRPASFLADLRRLASNGAWVAFLFASLIGCLYLGVETSYLFLYLRDLGADESLMGTALALMTLAEVPVWFLAPRMLDRWGARGLLAIALGAGTVQALIYSVLPAPWVALPVQLLHGLAFSAMWTAGVAYAADIAPPGTEATALGVHAAVQMGLGRALAAYVGGILLTTIGGAQTFRLTAFTSLAALALVLVGVHRRKRVRA